MLYNPHPQPFISTAAADARLPGWSVIRIGTGNLDLLAGGSVDERSTFAIYTAGAVGAAGTAYNLPRGTTTPILSTASGTAAFTRSAAGTTTIQGVISSGGTLNPSPTSLKDATGNVFFVTLSLIHI